MRRIFTIVFILTALLSSCKEQKHEDVAAEVLAENAEEPEIKLYTFDGGTVLVNKLELFSQGDEYKGQSKEFVDAFYVISHPKGNLMWDAGLPESLVGLPEPFTSSDGAFTVSRRDSVVNQLKKIGLTPEDFTYIALSHTHFDHVGHANAFKDATWLVQEAEYDFVHSDTVKENYPEIHAAVQGLTKVKKIKGDYDVFGDGTVVFKFMPGHTPGHQVLFLDLKNHGPVLLAGDLYHFSENRVNRRVPLFNHNVSQTIVSMKAFEDFAEQKNANVYLQHEPEDFKKMPKPPQYLH